MPSSFFHEMLMLTPGMIWVPEVFFFFLVVEEADDFFVVVVEDFFAVVFFWVVDVLVVAINAVV